MQQLREPQIQPAPPKGLEHLHILPTPHPITEGLLNRVEIKGTVIEPCAGHNAITDILIRHGLSVTATDIQWAQEGEGFSRDAMTQGFWDHFGRFDWVITNPTFSLGPDIMRYAWEYCNVGIAFLLRLSYQEPCENRLDLLLKLQDHQILQMPNNPRIIFKVNKDGKDGVEAMTTAWFVFRKDFSYKALGIESPFQYFYRWRESKSAKNPHVF